MRGSRGRPSTAYFYISILLFYLGRVAEGEHDCGPGRLRLGNLAWAKCGSSGDGWYIQVLERVNGKGFLSFLSEYQSCAFPEKDVLLVCVLLFIYVFYQVLTLHLLPSLQPTRCRTAQHTISIILHSRLLVWRHVPTVHQVIRALILPSYLFSEVIPQHGLLDRSVCLTSSILHPPSFIHYILQRPPPQLSN